VAVAERAVEEPSDISAPLVGPVRETVGADAATVKLTAVELTTEPARSVTRAVSEMVPIAGGVHVAPKGLTLEDATKLTPE
jgi:hypothetical protein